MIVWRLSLLATPDELNGNRKYQIPKVVWISRPNEAEWDGDECGEDYGGVEIGHLGPELEGAV